MKNKYKKFYLMFDKRFKKNRNLILCSNTLCDGGIGESSDFASRIKDTYLTFILNCRSDYLVAYPQKEQRIYKTKLSRMKLTF
jgi:hypothetical protein